METAAQFGTLARRDLPFYEFAREFCRLAVVTPLSLRCSGSGPITIAPWTSTGPSQNQHAAVRSSPKKPALRG